MDIAEALKLRQEIRVDPFRQGFGHVDSPNSIDLNAVKLCFQVQSSFNIFGFILMKYFPSGIPGEPLLPWQIHSDPTPSVHQTNL